MKSQGKKNTRTRETGNVETTGNDLRNEELSEDVACCLAEIDAALAENTDEETEARKRFDAANAIKEGRLHGWWDKYEYEMELLAEQYPQYVQCAEYCCFECTGWKWVGGETG